MAALVKALNAKIRSNPVSDYLCSTHFWGPVSNYSIPLAAVLDTRKSPELFVSHSSFLSICVLANYVNTGQSISGKMTGALTVYAFTFMRFSLAIRPKNYLLFACHSVNACAQTTQGYRYMDYHYWGGKESGKYASALGKTQMSGGDVVKVPEAEKMVVKPADDGVVSVVKGVKTVDLKK